MISEASSSTLSLRQTFTSITDGSLKPANPKKVYQHFVSPLQACFGSALAQELRTAIPSASHSAEYSFNQSVIAAAQKALLERIAIDWRQHLEKHGTWQPLVETWFFGLLDQPRNDARITTIDETAPTLQGSTSLQQKNGNFQLASLRTLSGLLSKPPHPSTSAAILDICNMAAQRLSLTQIYQAVQAEKNKARRDVAWKEAVRLLVSLPGRIANFTEGKVDEPLRELYWCSQVLASGLAEFIMGITNHEKDEACSAAAEILIRLDRIGYLAIPAISETSRGRDLSFWPSFLTTCSSLPMNKAQGHCWDATVGHNLARTFALLPSRERSRLEANLLGMLDAYMRHQGLGQILHLDEKSKPGREGTQLFGQHPTAFISAASQLLQDIFPLVEESVTDSDDEEDDRDGTGRVKEIFETIIIPGRKTQSKAISFCPAMGWALGYWLLQLSKSSAKQNSLLTSCLDLTSAAWSSQDRFKLASLEENQYLTTLFITLLSVSSSPSSMANSSSFLNGVTLYLEHADPQVRRLGMLVAELVSKDLNFGRGIWDGIGQGKEEARVLRALHDAWGTHCKAIEVHRWDAERIVEMLGLLNQEKEAEVQVVAPRRKRDKPVTRRLPVKKPPRLISEVKAPARPLITSLSDDDTNSSLQMFTDKPHPASDDENDTSSSENSSDEEAPNSTSQDEMTRLASDLTGLSPNETSSFTSKLSQNRDSHAPTFSKKPHRPVYISDLSTLLRSTDRSSVKLGLKSSASLIRRKANWGGEVDESAVDLLFSLISLQNNFSITQFQERRVAALKALVVASPRVSAGCLVEQLFHHQYSMVQRLDILRALAEGARELGGRGTEDVVENAITKAKQEGEKRVPEIRREKMLMLPSDRRLVTPAFAARPKERLVDLASSVFLLPLLRRFAVHLEDYENRRGYKGTNISGLFSGTILAALLDTLSIIVDAASNALEFRTIITPECLEVCLLLLRRGGEIKIVVSALSLTLVLLDRNHELDQGATALSRYRDMLDDLTRHAELVFSASESLRSTKMGKDDLRAARVSAAILLRLEEMRESQRAKMLSRLGGISGF